MTNVGAKQMSRRCPLFAACIVPTCKEWWARGEIQSVASDASHFPFGWLWRFRAFEWRILVSSVCSRFEVEFEVEVALLVLLYNKLKGKKRKHEILIDPLLNSQHKRRLCNASCLRHLATVQWTPTVPRSWTSYSFGNKGFGVEAMLQMEAQITEMSTAKRSGTLRHDAYRAAARQSRSAAGGDDMKPRMSVALLRGNTPRVVAPFQTVQLLHSSQCHSRHVLSALLFAADFMIAER
jgi:hypothetical protein